MQQWKNLYKKEKKGKGKRILAGGTKYTSRVSNGILKRRILTYQQTFIITSSDILKCIWSPEQQNRACFKPRY